MPSSPEFTNALGDEGVVEILKEVEAEDAAKTDGHIGVTREVEVQLQRDGNGIQPVAADAGLVHGVQCLAHRAELVCDQYFLGKTQDEAGHAVGEFFKGVCSLGQILLNRHVTDDRAGNQLREQCHVGSQVNEVLLGSSLAAIHVDGVAHGLEGVEADTDGQRQTEQRDVRAGNIVDVVNKEVGVFEEAKCSEAGDHRRPEEHLGQRSAAEAIDQKTVNIAGQRRRQHEQRVDRLTVEIEEQAGYQQHQVLEFERNGEVQDQYRCQKIIHKADTGKQQGGILLKQVLQVTGENRKESARYMNFGVRCAVWNYSPMDAGHIRKNTVLP